VAERSDASTLLFLHPVGLDRESVAWLDLPPVRSVTLPGHGDRRRARPGLTVADMADEIAGNHSGPLDVVGASLGGMVAMHLALNHPDRVRSLVLACTTPHRDPATLEARAVATETRGSDGMLEETLTRWFTDGFRAADPDAPPLAYARERLLATSAGVLADTWRAIGSHDVRDRLGAITVPTTCVAGVHDVSSPLPVMRDLAARIPGSRLVELDAPHMAFLESPGEFAEAVRDHLVWVHGRVPEGAQR
jgi:pimeloyl-ACP methyl ester carboxylesterase